MQNATLVGVPFLFALLAAPTLAQETYWIANRASSDIQEVDVCGRVVRTIPMGNTLRSAHRAPDGKVWVVRFIMTTMDIVDPATGSITPVNHSLGSAYSIAFDAAGHAWVTGGTGVEEFDATGASLGTYVLNHPFPLGITVDNRGNKWIAHRVNPGWISKIDPRGAISDFQISGSQTQPVWIIADYRDPFAVNPEASHVWVVGDSSGDIIEFDPSAAPGSEITVHSPPQTMGGNMSSMATDANGSVWVGDFRNGSIWQFDRASAAVVNTFGQPPSVNGLAFDGFGRLWSTHRVTFSNNGGPPCEVRRIDTTTGANEVPALVGFGTSSSLATLHHHALVVDPLGDLDLDGSPNAIELAFDGTSPFDGQSAGSFTLNVTGSTQVGSTATVEARAAPGAMVALAFATSAVAPGSGITLPPILNGEFLLGSLLAVTPAAVAPVSIPVGTTDPSLAGFDLFVQAFQLGATSFTVSNVSCAHIWQ